MSSPLPEGVEMVINKEINNERRLRSCKKNLDPRDDCERCKKGFATLEMLQTHIMAEHSHTNPSSTQAVLETLPTPPVNSRHKAKVSISCHLCDSTFTTKGALRVHMRIHTGVKPFQCQHCEKSFRTSGHRKSHIISTHTRKSTRSQKLKSQQYIEDKSDNEYSHEINSESSDNLEKSILNTSDSKFCDKCNKCFDKPSQLVRHSRMHSGVKPYVCDTCSKSFTQKNGLTTHLLTHSGLKPHECSHCGKSFSQPGNLKAHIQRVHSDLLSGVIVQYMQQE